MINLTNADEPIQCQDGMLGRGFHTKKTSSVARRIFNDRKEDESEGEIIIKGNGSMWVDCAIHDLFLMGGK